MRDYGKVFSAIWASATFRELSEDGRNLVLYLLTCPHGTLIGAFRLPDGYVCDDIQWGSERVCKGFAELEEKGFARRDPATMWVWVCKYLEWNPLENPNQRKSARKLLEHVPTVCPWRLDLARSLADEPMEGGDNPSSTLSKPGTGAGAGTGEKKGAKAPLSPAPPPPLPDCPHQKLLALFAEKVPALPRPKPELWDGEKAENLKLRWRWLLTAKRSTGEHAGERYAESEAQALDWFGRFFDYVQASDFLTGRDSKAWRGCSLEWLVKAGNFSKVVQGNYANAETA